jgi:DNA-binding response OmpR family regulator
MSRQIPLIVVASATPGLAERVATQLRQQGAVAYPTHSADGCLKVATSVGPDVIVLDPALPRSKRFEQLLRAHPMSARAQVMQLAPESLVGTADTPKVVRAAA